MKRFNFLLCNGLSLTPATLIGLHNLTYSCSRNIFKDFLQKSCFLYYLNKLFGEEFLQWFSLYNYTSWRVLQMWWCTVKTHELSGKCPFSWKKISKCIKNFCKVILKSIKFFFLCRSLHLFGTFNHVELKKTNSNMKNKICGCPGITFFSLWYKYQ